MIAGESLRGFPRTTLMQIRFLTNWKNRKAGDIAELSGREAAAALRDKAAEPVASRPRDRAEKRLPHAERR